MMILHEAGHVVTALLTGGSVSKVVLHPLQISWTALDQNPHPLLVAWGGPILGSILPLALAWCAHRFNREGLYLFKFFAGFCFAANGFYLLIDAFEKGGDGRTLLNHGAAVWQLLLFALVTIPLGFRLWNGLGIHFGLGEARGKVNHHTAYFVCGLLLVVIVIELLLYRPL